MSTNEDITPFTDLSTFQGWYEFTDEDGCRYRAEWKHGYTYAVYEDIGDAFNYIGLVFDVHRKTANARILDIWHKIQKLKDEDY